jgi:ABC-type Mn2+/Zn2+ transport system ATPase subunit
MDELIRLEGVTCRYGAEPVVIDVDLAIEPGAFIGVVGPSGSGKTTLLKAITGSVRPVSGRVTRPGGPVTVGYVPQVDTVNWFFPVTVREAVLMGRAGRRVPWASREEVREMEGVLARLGLSEVAGRRPSLLLLDEPTSGVDVRTRHEVVHLLHELHHDGLAILVTTHDLNGIAAHLPELVCLNREVVAHGSPAEVLTPEVLERTYGAPMEVLQHGGMPVVVEGAPLPEVVPVRGEHHGHPA